MSIQEPLALRDLLINTIAGNQNTFVFLSVILISAFAAKFQMPKSVFVLLMGLYLVMLSQYVGGIFLIVLLLAAFAIFASLAKVFT